VAAVLEREFGQEIDLVHGAYGQFKIEVDGREVLDAGMMAALGIIPSNDSILAAVRRGLEQTPA